MITSKYSYTPLQRNSVDGQRLYATPEHLVYLDGMTIDYQRRGLNEGFDFINHNEKDRCGCGESFRV